MPVGGLRPHQLDAVDRMFNGCILNGNVGSGKSRTAIAYYFKENGGRLDVDDYIPMNDPPQDLYIITTAKKRDELEWEVDMAPFLISAAHPEVDIYDHGVTVDSWNNIHKYIDVEDAFFIFDEQRLVGSGTWVKSFYKIAKKNNWILLTATPGDKWEDYTAVFVANGYYRNKTEFNQTHIVWSPFTKYPSVQKYLSEGHLIRLRDHLLINMDDQRQTVAHHEDVYCSFDVTMYKDISRNRWNFTDNKPIESASEYCYQLRKVVNESPDRQLKLLEIYEDHPKAIIFYNFDYELEILRDIFKGIGIEYKEWNGHKHQPIPTGDKWVYLVQYTAGCEGWNCITTDTIIFFSQNYSYKTLMQACGRIDRLNTPYKDLYYYHIKSRAGIDLAISKALAAKKKFNEGRFVFRTHNNKGVKNEYNICNNNKRY